MHAPASTEHEADCTPKHVPTEFCHPAALVRSMVLSVATDAIRAMVNDQSISPFPGFCLRRADAQLLATHLRRFRQSGQVRPALLHQLDGPQLTVYAEQCIFGGLHETLIEATDAGWDITPFLELRIECATSELFQSDRSVDVLADRTNLTEVHLPLPSSLTAV